MSWLSKILGRDDGKEQERREPTAITLDNAIEVAGDVIKGWRLSVTMSPRTPLKWLRRHGEVHLGRNRPDVEVPPEHAVWLPQTKSWSDLGFDFAELPPSTMASMVGQIPEDGGDFLPFLIRYRKIIEGPSNSDPDLQIEALKAEYPQYAPVLEPKRRNKR